jgi:ribosomal protein L24E
MYSNVYNEILTYSKIPRLRKFIKNKFNTKMNMFYGLNINAIYLIENIIKITPNIYSYLSTNSSAIHILEKNIDKINWINLSEKSTAIDLLEKNPDKINWDMLSSNPTAIKLLEKNPNKINWTILSSNPSAIKLLEKNIDKINWDMLSENSAAIHLLESNPDKINWKNLSSNTSAIHLLESNPDKINWTTLSLNSAAIHLLEEQDENYSKTLHQPRPTPQYIKPKFSKHYRLPRQYWTCIKNKNKIDWYHLFLNHSAYNLLHKYLINDNEKNDCKDNALKYTIISQNPAIIPILKKKKEYINYMILSNKSIFSIKYLFCD